MPNQPVRLHGVVDSVDPASHSISIGGLSGLEYFWGPDLQHCPVAPNLDVSALQPGTKVAVTVTRPVRTPVYISAIERE